jgi:CRISPR system Cascade subunit CasB
MTVLAARTQLEDLERSARALEKAAKNALRVPGDRAALRRSLGKPPEHQSVQPAHRLVAPHLPAFLSDAGVPGASEWSRIDDDAVERAFYTVAALIAAQPRDARDEHLAAGEAHAAAADAADRTGSDGAAPADAGAASSAETSGGDTATTVTTSDGKAPENAGPPPSRSLGHCIAKAINGEPQHEREDAFRRMEPRLRLLCRQDVDGLHRHLPRLVRHLRAEKIDIDWVRLTVDLARWGGEADFVAKRWLQDFYRTARPHGGGSGGRHDDGDASDSSDASTDDTENEA